MRKETGYCPQNFTNKKLLAKPVIRKVADILSKNWEELKGLADSNICFRGISKEDILIDTFEHVIRDQSLKKSPEKEIIDRFKKEFKQLYYRAVRNSKIESGKINSYENKDVKEIKTKG